MSGVFAALADPSRRLVLELLAPQERSAGELVDAVREHAPMSQPAVSQHLRVLREAGLVAVRVEGSRRFYALETAGLEAAQVWLATLTDVAAPFAQPFDALATEVARGHRARAGDRTERGRNLA